MAAPGAAAGSALVYDSDVRLPPLVNELVQLRRYRGLLRLLVVRDLTLRYKRSLLGVWWTILNPLLTTGVMWVVFSAIFRFRTPGAVPFIVYLLSGVLMVTLFQQGINVVGQSVVGSAAVLTKVYVPPEVFAVSAGVAAACNFMLAMLPLLVIQLATGAGIPWTILLVPIPVVAMLALVTGLGLLVATAAIRFADALDLVAIGVVMIGYLTPTFYPITIVPDRYRAAIESNPIYSYLTVFRQLCYGGPAAAWWMWVMMLATAAVALALGAWTFSRRWPHLAALL
ncbi:MAG: ABC transporter permease [Mycobacteriales bacterium]